MTYAANNKPTPIPTSTDDTVDLTQSHQDETCDSGNINSDSLSSFMSDSSMPSKTHVRPQKYAKGKINEMKLQTIIPEQVDLIPWDIDGDKVYHVKKKITLRNMLMDGGLFFITVQIRVSMGTGKQVFVQVH